MPKWEYKLIDSKNVKSSGLLKGRAPEDLEAYLNVLGEEGWEVVNLDFLELESRLSFVGVAKRAKG